MTEQTLHINRYQRDTLQLAMLHFAQYPRSWEPHHKGGFRLNSVDERMMQIMSAWEKRCREEQL